ncbi:hypothetical protein ACQPXM_16155 [Kribbella sp. CA-253562]|uniref:hypothetical protein n=1 Tax=Kribbella sp. CA-253562 TaxID=3239942 RepID=UPI003D8E6F42
MSAAEKARATWTQKFAGPTNARHWTQQPAPEAGDQTTGPDPATVTGDVEPAQSGWTLSLATDPASTANAGASAGADTGTDGDEKPQLWQVPDETPGDDFPDHWRTSGEQQSEPATGQQGEWGPAAVQQQGAPVAGEQQQWGPAAGERQAQWGPAGEQQGPWADQQTTPQWQTGGQQSDPWHAAQSASQTGTAVGAGGWGPQQGGPAQWQAATPGPTGGGTRQKSGGDKSGGPPKTMLVIAGAVGLVLIIVAGVFFVANRDDKKVAPQPTTSVPTGTATGTPSPSPTPTSQPTTPPGSQSTIKPGQSKNPKLHEGARIASDAISFPRQRPPWSDRKRLVPQLINSSGQYVLLQEKFDGKNSWYADAFVGALGTSVLFNGDPKATAADLSTQIRSSMYGNIPAQFKWLRDGAVKRSGKNGWYYQQSVTTTSPKVAAKVLTLTVAVFDLGDGTAVAYISDIPTTRPDLRAAEAQIFKGINVG